MLDWVFLYITSLITFGLALYKAFYKYGPPDYFKLSGVPAPRPLWDFDIDNARPRPYRPFRWEYHQTMALKKLEPDYWLELESTYRSRLEQRKQLYTEHGSTVLAALPGSEQACIELAEMAIQFLCARYPRQFQFSRFSEMFHNCILGTHSSTREWGRFKSRSQAIGDGAKEESAGVRALEFLLQHVPEDFAIMQADPVTGLYVLRAGIIMSAIGWTLSGKLGKPVHEIHAPVPDYKTKLQFSMDRFFTKLTCDKPIQRGSWALEIGEPLFAPPGSPHMELRSSQSPTLNIDNVTLRVDWQTLRRLPISQAIVFNYKALFTPITAFRDEPYIPRLVAKVIREGKEGMIEYKGTWHIQHKVLPALDEWAKEQERKGWVPREWKERTLDEDPFFPGWNDPSTSTGGC